MAQPTGAPSLGDIALAHRFDAAALDAYLQRNIDGFGANLKIEQFQGGVDAAGSSGLSSSSLLVIAVLNSRMPLPSDRPISGRRFGPKTRRTTRARSSSSHGEIQPGMQISLARFPRTARGDALTLQGLLSRRSRRALERRSSARLGRPFVLGESPQFPSEGLT